VIDHYSERPVYQQLADLLRAGIAEGKYPAGTWLPGTRELTADHELAAGTVRKSLAVLKQEGLIRTVPGRGNVVLEPRRKPK
jgi:DNA-binding GntR family transcriptional regulator